MGNCCGCNPLKTNSLNDTEPIDKARLISSNFSCESDTLKDEDPIRNLMQIVGKDFNKLQVINAYQLTGKNQHDTINYLYNNGYTNIGANDDFKYDTYVNANKDSKTTLTNSLHLLRLIKYIRIDVDTGDYKIDDDDMNICQLLDDYLYLQQYHNTDNEFEYIYYQLGGFCDIQTCDVFKRNHNNSNTFTGYDTSRYQILDKIHCFYCHTFDIGLRLTQQERDILHD
eukprot:35456_1